MPISEARFDEAIDQAARLLSVARLPVIAGLGTDIAGAVAAFRLAEKLGGVVDHMSAEAGLREQAVLQELGLMLISPDEARRRADAFLLVGDGALATWPDLPGFLLTNDSTLASANPRQCRLISLSSAGWANSVDLTEVFWLKAGPREIPSLLAALRARINGRPVAREFATADIDRCADILRNAAFGIAIWCPDELHSLAIEMLVGLIKDLNEETRWSGLSVARDIRMVGVAMASGWMSALPLRVSYSRTRPEHDPWRFDSRRLVESGEADAVLWISAFGDPVPAWLRGVPAILLAGPDDTSPQDVADVLLAVGKPGKDHDAMLYDRRSGTLAAVTATTPSNLPSVADILSRIGERLPVS
jgi:formylmethanofuran dehydrogenase subunit B